MSSLYHAEKATAKLIKAVFDILVIEPLNSSQIIARLADASDTAMIRRTVRNMMRRGEIKLRGGQRLAPLEVTNKGANRYQRLRLLAKLDEFNQRLTAENWDDKWRILIYDIPESEHSVRDLIRQLISEIGLYQYQRSVWVTPYDCAEQVTMIQQVYGESSDITLIKADRFQGDDELIEHFGL